MFSISQYLKNYFRNLSYLRLGITTGFTILLIACNYNWNIEKNIKLISFKPLSLLLFFLAYTSIYGIAFLIQGFRSKAFHIRSSSAFYTLLLVSPLYFACKMLHWPTGNFFSVNPALTKYYSIILQWPLKLALLLLLILLLWRSGGSLTYQALIRKFPAKPYCWLLLAMLPLIALASVRPDFVHSYPKLRSIYFITQYSTNPWPWYLLFESSYGSDFLSIELFFRGLLVVGMSRYAGKDCILPMAVFYCCVHFGKPLAECISSFGGGLLLGIIAYYSRSIGGGLLLHLGIAFLMEAAGYIAHHLIAS